MNSIITFKNLKKLQDAIKGIKVVVTGGCFDVLHLGHIKLLEKARQKGDLLIVLLESDERIKKLKGKNRPIHTQNIRAKILSSLQMVDYVICLPLITSDVGYDQLISKLNPSVIATTDTDPGIIHKKRQAKMIGAKLAIVTKKIEDHSSTKIARILAMEI